MRPASLRPTYLRVNVFFLPFQEYEHGSCIETFPSPNEHLLKRFSENASVRIVQEAVSAGGALICSTLLFRRSVSLAECLRAVESEISRLPKRISKGRSFQSGRLARLAHTPVLVQGSQLEILNHYRRTNVLFTQRKVRKTKEFNLRGQSGRDPTKLCLQTLSLSGVEETDSAQTPFHGDFRPTKRG